MSLFLAAALDWPGLDPVDEVHTTVQFQGIAAAGVHGLGMGAAERRMLGGTGEAKAMIKRFHVLYVGQIALDNVGVDGTPANDRRYATERLQEVFATSLDVAKTMDALGYHALWTAEHHFQREGYECLPNLIQLGLWLATQTKQLKFGCAFNVLPMWHPIRPAEDYAMADLVTDGRVIMGVGRGYHTREVETFGAPLLDAEANREYFEEQLQLLLKCFNEEGLSTTRENISNARRRCRIAATRSGKSP